MSRDGTAPGVRRLLGMPPSLSRETAARIERSQAALVSEASMDTECSGEESNGGGGEVDEEVRRPSQEEEPTPAAADKKPKRRKKRRIRLTDQGLKAKRKAERREKMMQADKKIEVKEEEEPDETQMGEGSSPLQTKEKEMEEIQPEKEKVSPETFTPFQLLCDNILRKLVAKDPDGYFINPVTEDEAPDYCSIIEQPMDFSTTRQKIEQNVYSNFDEFKKDVMLISDNACLYNSPTNVYHLAAKKLALISKYYLSEKYLQYLYYTLPFTKSLSQERLGFRLGRQEKSKSRQKGDGRQKGLESINDTQKAEELAKLVPQEIKERLTSRKPSCHIAYLDNKNGAIALNILTASPGETKQLTLGDYVKPLAKGNPGICTPFEPRICHDYMITYTNPGPYATFAPQYDTTWATLSKRDSDLLLSCYGDKDNVSDAEALRQMISNAGPMATSMVDSMLDELTDNQHSATLAQLEIPEKMNELSEPTISGSINKTGKLIEELASMQHQRLSKAPPATLKEAAQPGADEAKLAGQIVQELGNQVVEMGAKPGDLISSNSLHHALGLDADDYDVLSEFLEV